MWIERIETLNLSGWMVDNTSHYVSWIILNFQLCYQSDDVLRNWNITLLFINIFFNQLASWGVLIIIINTTK